MPDIVAIGELLVDFSHIIADGADAYRPCAGGAPANVACMAAKLGADTGFIGNEKCSRWSRVIGRACAYSVSMC